MVSPMHIVIIGIIAALVAAIPIVFQFKGQPTLWDKIADDADGISIPQIGNETFKIPRNGTFDFGDWVQEVPFTDIWKAMTDGVIGLVNWLAKGLVGILNIIFGRLIPGFLLPSWFGIIVVVFVFVMVMAQTFEGVANFSFSAYHKVAIAGLIGIMIAFVFIFAGFMR